MSQPREYIKYFFRRPVVGINPENTKAVFRTADIEDLCKNIVYARDRAKLMSAMVDDLSSAGRETMIRMTMV